MGLQITKNDGGFSLIELLVVIAILAVLLALVIPSIRRNREGANELMIRARLASIASAESTYRVSLGRRTYGTLQQLRTTNTGGAPLLSQADSPADAAGNPISANGWTIREIPGQAPTATSFAIEAFPDVSNAATSRYCVYEDAIVRFAPRAQNCLRTSPAVSQ